MDKSNMAVTGIGIPNSLSKIQENRRIPTPFDLLAHKPSSHLSLERRRFFGGRKLITYHKDLYK